MRKHRLFSVVALSLLAAAALGQPAHTQSRPPSQTPSPALSEHVRAGQLKMRSSDFSGAVNEFSLAIADDPNDVAAYRLRAEAEAILRRFDAALADYTRAIALDPRNSAALEDRANFKSNQHDFAGALADIDQAIALHSGMPPLDFLYDFRARTNLALHRDDEALADINRALQLAPALTPHLYTRETIEIARQAYDAAIADDTQIIALTRAGDRAVPYLRRGDAKEAKGDHAYASRTIQRSLISVDSAPFRPIASAPPLGAPWVMKLAPRLKRPWPAARRFRTTLACRQRRSSKARVTRWHVWTMRAPSRI
jgi:tetratricopeptide (TPR) repeat protein